MLKVPLTLVLMKETKRGKRGKLNDIIDNNIKDTGNNEDKANYEEVDNSNLSEQDKYSEYDISINSSDVLFVLTLNNSKFKENVTSLIGKMIVIKEDTNINLLGLSNMLNAMQLDKLHIYSISGCGILNGINTIQIKEPCLVNYIEIGIENFLKHLNSNNPNVDFMNYNKDSLYILRNGNYMDIKNFLTKIKGCNVSIGRGGGQKAHVVSPLDFRLSCYLMAMFNLDYKYISNLNAFNSISKSRYLPYFGRDKDN